MTLWIIIVSIGLFTYGIRLAFIVLSDRVALPALAQRGLRFVPVAILTAITIPALVFPAGTLDLSPLNARLPAGIIAVIVAWRTRNIALTLACGMGALWLLQWVIS
jgi:branched-subunit amino acid transport protein